MKTKEEKQQEREARERMRPAVRDIIAQIDTIFARGSKPDNDGRSYYSSDAIVARQLWDVLSALRGPDYEKSLDKNATTAVIRAALFPKTFSDDRSIAIPAHMAYDETGNAQIRSQMIESYHFKNHAKKAFAVLGLNWITTNSREQVDGAATPFKKRKTSKSKSKTKKSRSSK